MPHVSFKRLSIEQVDVISSHAVRFQLYYFIAMGSLWNDIHYFLFFSRRILHPESPPISRSLAASGSIWVGIGPTNTYDDLFRTSGQI
jgi:hypothetical protein